MDFLSAAMTETQPPLRLPRANEATIPPEKLRDYALNPDHEPDGKHKARVFAAALGIRRENWEYLRDELLARLPEAPVQGVRQSRWGYEYEILIWVDGLNGNRQPVITAWLVEPGAPPRLTTAYVEKSSTTENQSAEHQGAD
jgi:hypothetical protein